MPFSYFTAPRPLVLFRTFRQLALFFLGLFRVAPVFARKSARKRIAFQAYSVHLAQSYRTIVAELRKDPDAYDLFFVILPHPHFPNSSRRELRRFVQETMGWTRPNIKSYWQCLWERYDLLVCVDVYARFPLLRTKKMLLAHGPGLTKRFITRHPFHKTLLDFDLVLLNGDVDLRIVRTALKEDEEPRVLSAAGFPFVDELQHIRVAKGEYFERLGLDRERSLVLVAPSWEGLRMAPGRGVDWVEEVVGLLASLRVNTVVKLHACSFNPIMAGGVHWRDRLRQLTRATDVRIDFDVDDLPALASADVLITDISSRAFCFMLLGKRVILYRPPAMPRDEWDEQRFHLMERAAEVAQTVSDLATLLEPANGHDSSKIRNAEEVAAQCFAHYGSATQNVIELIQTQLARIR